MKERGSIRGVQDPATGKTLLFPSSPIRLRPVSPEVQFPGLPVGAANEFVLEDLLGYSPEEVAKMKADGAILKWVLFSELSGREIILPSK